jgi:hypothetical protein
MDGSAVGQPIHAQAAAGGAVTAETLAIGSPLGALLVGHVLHEGEVVLLLLKPSLWFVPLASLRFIGVVLIALAVCDLAGLHPSARHGLVGEAAGLAVAGRLVWAMFHWFGRVYVLTDLRIIRMSGVLAVELFDCPLRKIRRTRRRDTVPERLLRLGTINVYPQDPECCGHVPRAWQTIAKPGLVHEQIVAAVNRAQQGG